MSRQEAKDQSTPSHEGTHDSASQQAGRHMVTEAYSRGGHGHRRQEHDINEQGTNGLPAVDIVNPAQDHSEPVEQINDYTKPVPIIGLEGAANRVFFRVDVDRDGYLSKSELTAAMEDRAYIGQDAQTVAALYKSCEYIQRLSNDEYGEDNDGISRQDICTFTAIQDDTIDKSEKLDVISKWSKAENSPNFKTADTNGDGFLTDEEIEQALQDANLSQTNKRGLEFIQQHAQEIRDAANDETGWEDSGITVADLAAYQKAFKESDKFKSIQEVSNAFSGTSQSQIPGICLDLYRTPGRPEDSIKPDDIRQGTIGDCYFEATLASLAQQRPDQIKNMIHDNEDGTYTVTFPGDSSHKGYIVKKPTEAEMGLYNKGSKNGTWALVMEKAYGSYRQEHDGNHAGEAPAAGGDGGGRSGPVIELLTGNPSHNVDVCEVTRESLAQQLDEALKSGKLVTCDTPGMSDKETTKDGWAACHEYTVTSFVPDGKGGGTVTVRNPWGGPSQQVPMDEFMTNVRSIDIEGPDPRCT